MNLGPYQPNGYVVGDCRALLRELPDESVNCCVTSPPYWMVRDYGTATWEGGDPECAHLGKPKPRQNTSGGTNGRFTEERGTQPSKAFQAVPVRGMCKCGARRVDLQIGLEESSEAYVAAIVDVFREVRRVLKTDGTCWINCGDGYVREPQKGDNSGWGKHAAIADFLPGHNRPTNDLRPKQCLCIPWRLGLSLQADGWWLRRPIIWHKPNAMPESVADRPSADYEYLLFLTKSERYWYDAKAIAEDAVGDCPHDLTGQGQSPPGQTPSRGNRKALHGTTYSRHRSSVPGGQDLRAEVTGKRNKRSVWRINTEPSSDEHYACMPRKLVEPCILAGCAPGGIVIDPFGGSGTVGRVAEDLGRKWLLFDLSAKYAEIAKRKTAQTGILGRCW